MMPYTDNPFNFRNRNGDFSVLVSFAVVYDYFQLCANKSLIQERVLWPVWLFASDLASGSSLRALSCKRLIRKRIPGRSKRQWVYGPINSISSKYRSTGVENTVECEMMDPKQAMTKESGQALRWLRQKLISQASMLVEV